MGMNKNSLVKRVSVVFNKPNEEKNYSAWPNVTRLSDGRLMAVWSGNRLAHSDPWGAIVASYSGDDGITWSKPRVIFDSPLDDRDPNIYVDGNTIFIGYFTQWDIYRPGNPRYYTAEEHARWADYYYSISAEAVEKYGSPVVNGISNNYLISRDGGETWNYGGKISAHNPKGVIKLQDGRYFYVTTQGESGASGKLSYITSTNLIDWSEKTIIHDVSEIEGAAEPTAYQTKRGRIIVMMRSAAGLYQCYSDNNGQSFTGLKLVDVAAGASGTPVHLIQHSSGVLVMTYGYRAKPYGVATRVSYNEGETWSALIELVCQGSSFDLGYTSTVERKDGTLLTIWYGRENATDKNCGIHYVIWGLPEFSRSLRLSAILSGKRVSILGTSIECYNGISNNGQDYNTTMASNPAGYGTNGYGDDLDSVYDTWWMQVITAADLHLNVNNSAAGARCMTDHPSVSSLIAGYKDERCLNLHDNTNPYDSTDMEYRVDPDIILVSLGINDLRNGNEAGRFEYINFDTLILENSGGYTYATPTTFAEAYAIMLHKITINYSRADIFLLNLPATTEAQFNDGTFIAYNDIIAKLAKKYGCTLVDICGADFSGAKYAKYTFDGLHPVKTGMDKIAEVVIDALETKYLN